MQRAEVNGAHATPKGLRHAFGVACAVNKIPLPIIQKWLGHEHMETTAIYMQATGEEERSLAACLW